MAVLAVARRRQRRRQAALAAWGRRLATFLVVAGVWQVFGERAENVLIPTFTATMAGFVQLALLSGQLWEPLLISNQALALGYAISVVVGIPLGLAIGRSHLADRAFSPWIGVVLALPIAPLMPIVIIALGLTLAARVAIVVLFTFIFITVNTRAGVRNMDHSLIEMARAFGATERQVWRHILLPGALPAVFAGLRIGLGRAVAGMVIVELLLIASGIGRLLLGFTGRLQADLVFATVLAIVLEAVLLISLMQLVERRVAPWTTIAAAD